MKVYLTGGTGLLGSHVARRLKQEGADVVALHRPSSTTTFLADLGCTLMEGDLGDAPDRHARAMEGCTGVVHAAAHIYGGPSLEAVRRVNVEGARHVAEGAFLAGVENLVHISSVAVYGDPPGPMEETTPLNAPLEERDYYGRTKREAEDVIGAFHGRGTLAVTVLRPPALYGERDRLFVPRLMALLRGPLVFLLGSGDTRLAAVYAGNAAEAVERALEGRGGGEVFNITEDVGVTQRGLLEGLARRAGREPRFVSVPAALARAGARWGDRLGIAIPGAPDLPLKRVVRLSTEDNPYPAEKARAILGWDPPFSLREALDRTGEWMVQELETET